MGIIYDMGNGRFQSLTTENGTVPARDEDIPAPSPRLVEAFPAEKKVQPHAQTMQLIRALLRSS